MPGLAHPFSLIFGPAPLTSFVMWSSPVPDMLRESCHQRETNYHITCINGDVMRGSLRYGSRRMLWTRAHPVMLGS